MVHDESSNGLEMGNRMDMVVSHTEQEQQQQHSAEKKVSTTTIGDNTAVMENEPNNAPFRPDLSRQS